MQTDARFEVFERKVFIRGMGPAIRRGEAEQKSFAAEEFAEGLDDGNASSFAHKGGGAPEYLFEGAQGGGAPWTARIHDIRHSAVAPHNFHFDAGGLMIAEVDGDEIEDAGGFLTGNKPEGQFG